MRMGVTDLQNCNTTLYITPSTTLIMKTTEVYGERPKLERAWKLVRDGSVFVSRENHFKAIVRGKGSKSYKVNLALGTCQCEDHQFNPQYICKHLRAVDIVEKIRTGEIVVPYEVKN